MTDDRKRKRERSKNFLEEEKEYLIELVNERKAILENKKTDAVSSKQKLEAWAAVATKFNASAKSGIRSPMQLKLLYENIKRTTKKKIADEKVQVYKTGGGENSSASLSTCETLIAELLGPTIQPLDNIFDSNEQDVPTEEPSTSALPSRYELSEDENIEERSEQQMNSQPICSEKKVRTFFKKIRKVKHCTCEKTLQEKIFCLKKERHAKKMEILEIIKEKELEDLRGKKLDNLLKEQKCASST